MSCLAGPTRWLCFAQSTSRAPAPCRDATSCVSANALMGPLPMAPAAPIGFVSHGHPGGCLWPAASEVGFVLHDICSSSWRFGLSGRWGDARRCVSTEMPLAGTRQMSPLKLTGFVLRELPVQGHAFPTLCQRRRIRASLLVTGPSGSTLQDPLFSCSTIVQTCCFHVK